MKETCKDTLMKNTVNMGGKDDRGFVKDNYHIITCSYLGRGKYMTVLMEAE